MSWREDTSTCTPMHRGLLRLRNAAIDGLGADVGDRDLAALREQRTHQSDADRHSRRR